MKMGPQKSGRLDKSCNSFDCISLTLDTSTLIAEQHFKINKRHVLEPDVVHTPLIPEIEEARPVRATW